MPAQHYIQLLREVVAYLRKSSAFCVSECAGTHARIIIRIMVVFFHCEMVIKKQKGRI